MKILIAGSIALSLGLGGTYASACGGGTNDHQGYDRDEIVVEHQVTNGGYHNAHIGDQQGGIANHNHSMEDIDRSDDGSSDPADHVESQDSHSRY